MKKSKFFRLYISLSEKEQEKFLQFVSLMYARQKKAVQLLIYIADYKNQVDADYYLDRNNALFAVFGKVRTEKKDEKNILNALSDLTKWLENFFICESKDTSSFSKDLLVANLYKERGLHQDYQHKLNYAKREANNSTFAYI